MLSVFCPSCFFLSTPPPPKSPLFPYPTLFRSRVWLLRRGRCARAARTIGRRSDRRHIDHIQPDATRAGWRKAGRRAVVVASDRSEEHTSELQSQSNIVCRLLLAKKKSRLT